MRRRFNTSNQYLNSKLPQADHLYQEVTISSDDQKTIHDTSYNIRLQQDIIGKANDYYIGISELKIPTRYLPVMVFKTKVDGTLSDYSMRLSIADGGDPLGFYATAEILEWNDQNGTQIDFDTGDRVSRISGTNKLYTQNVFTDVQGRKWYYIYNELDFIEMVNEKLSDMFDIIDWPNVDDDPKAYISLINDRLRLNIHDDAFNAERVSQIKLTFSDALYQLFSGFHALKLTPEKSGPVADIGTWLLQINKTGSNRDELEDRDGDDGIFYYTEDRRENFLESWNPVKRIVVTSGELLVEARGSVILNRSQLKNVLLSFIPNDMETKGYAYYKSEGSYDNLHDLLNNRAINEIDLKFWWEDSLGNLHPIEIPYDTNILLTLKFVKKQLINNFYRSDTL